MNYLNVLYILFRSAMLSLLVATGAHAAHAGTPPRRWSRRPSR